MKDRLAAISMLLMLLISITSIAIPTIPTSASPSSVTVTPFVVERNLATGSWISFSTEQTIDGDHSVKMHLPGTEAGRYDQGLKAGIESPYSKLPDIDPYTLSFKVYGDLLYEASEVHSPYIVIVVDLGADTPHGRLVFFHPTYHDGWGPRMTVTGTGWMDASPAYPDEWIGWFADGTEFAVFIGWGHDTGDFTGWDYLISDYAGYTGYTVLHFCIQYGFKPGEAEHTAYVDDLTIGTTYNFEPASEVWVNNDWTTTSPWAEPGQWHGGEAVDGHIFGKDAFATIQDAIDAVASSGTVHVYDGTYTENLAVNKALTIQAASRPIIDGGAAGDCISISANNVVISGFEIRNGYNGIGGQTSGSTFSNNIIHDNLNIPGYAGIGILLWGDNDDNAIVGNEIYDNDRQGIFIGYQDDSKISTDNVIEDNVVYNNGLYRYENGPDASAYGIQLWCADDNVIQENEVYGHDDWFPYGGTFDFAQGIYLCDSNDNNIMKNYLHDNNYGVGLWHPARSLGNNYINYNNIAGNTGYGVCNYDGIQVDARFNWWGDESGPSGSGPGSGDAISDYVKYSPWLGYPFGTTPMTYHVDPTGKIQDAIDDATSGDTILVYSGTYNEALYINKTLTIKAASKPIVKGSQSVTTNYGDRDAVIFVENAADVTIEGLDIEGEGLGFATKDYGVIFEESSGTIIDCIVSPNTAGDMNSVGIGAWDSSDLTIEGTTIENFGRIGVFYFNDCIGGVYDSTIIGQVYDEEDKVNYGIEVEGYTAACDIEIVSNEIYNCDNTYSPEPLWSSAGIMIDGWMAYYAPPTVYSSTVVIEGNDIHDNYYGIEVVANSLSYAHCNKIHDNRKYGVISEADSLSNYVTFDATHNWWGSTTGPTHPGNPEGTGDKVSDYVDYDPWVVAPTFKVEPSYVKGGETFQINVTINDVDPCWKVTTVEFWLSFNTTILEVVDVTTYNWLEPFVNETAGESGPIVLVDVSKIPGTDTGFVCVGMMIFPDEYGNWYAPWAEGSGVLATITFNTTRVIGKTCLPEVMNTTIHFYKSLLLNTEDWVEIPHETEDGEYNYVTILGDVNGDDLVDIKDLAPLAAAYGESPGRPRWNPDYDINCDEVIDIKDLAIVASRFGNTLDP